MAARKNFKLGDLLLIPLENDLFGVGRILRRYEGVILIEYYKIKPIKSESEFNFEEAVKEKHFFTNWTYASSIKDGGWLIFGNKPVPDNYDMPFYWRDDGEKYYIQKGTDEPFLTGERIVIPREDIHKYSPDGIGNEICNKEGYIYRLKAAGLL